MRITLPEPHPIRWLMLGGGLLIVAIAIGALIVAGHLRGRALDDSARELNNTVLLLARHFDQQLEQLGLIETSLVAQVHSAGIATREDFDRQLSTHEVHLTLNDKIGALSYVGVLSLIDSEGTQTNTTYSWPVGSFNIADREYFQALKSRPELNTLLSEPVVNRVTGEWTIILARKLTGNNGQFLGLVIGSIELAQFETFFSSLALGEGASIGLFHADGVLMVRHPHVDNMIGRNFISGPVHQQILTRMDHGSMRLDSPVDGSDRLASARRLEHFPISVIATTTVSAALADWKEQTKLLIGAAGLLVFVIAGMLLLIVRQLSQHHRFAGKSLALEKRRLDVALNNMTQGLLLFDSTERLLLCNQRFIEMYGLSSDVAKPGCTFRDLIAHRKETGSFDGDVDEYCDHVLRNAAREDVTREVRQTPDGRLILVVTRPLADGGWVATDEDITERKRSDERIAFLAYHDALTELPNRVLFGKLLLETLTASTKAGDSVALFAIDLDAFQEINEAVGVPAGDDVLRKVSKRICSFAELHEGYAARTGGDEFALFFTYSAANESIQNCADDLCRELSSPLLVGDDDFTIEACVGIATFPFASVSTVDVSVKELGVSELMKRAAIALLSAKRAGRGMYRLYSADLDDRQRHQMVLRQSLRKAIEDRQFRLHYHPLVELASGKIVGAEALVRWDHPTLGLQRPDIFIPLAERSGLIVPLGAWVMHEAMRQVEEWRRLDFTVPKIAVNVSSVQLLAPEFLRTVESIIADTGARASYFELELTEGFMIEASSTVLKVLKALKTMGFTLAVDDFGTGHASFGYLRNLPIDKIKIDQTFVRQLVIDSSDASIIRAIIALGKGLNIEVVAEGIETIAQRNFLRDEGCRIGQGYLFSLPLAAEDFCYLLDRGITLPIASSKDASVAVKKKVA